MRSPRDHTIRRSVALPQSLVDDLTRTAPPELRSNLNRLVIVALQEFVKVQKRRAFDEAMANMSASASVQAELRDVQRELSQTDSDGLSPEDGW